eukprot:951605-Pyramimonas_sp.AAC.1
MVDAWRYPRRKCATCGRWHDTSKCKLPDKLAAIPEEPLPFVEPAEPFDELVDAWRYHPGACK